MMRLFCSALLLWGMLCYPVQPLFAQDGEDPREGHPPPLRTIEKAPIDDVNEPVMDFPPPDIETPDVDTPDVVPPDVKPADIEPADVETEGTGMPEVEPAQVNPAEETPAEVKSAAP